MNFKKFETRAPSHQNAIDIFSDRWASDLSPIASGAISGDAGHFHINPKPDWAAQTLGIGNRFDGMSILELGPLEGGNTYNLERLGANVLGIEANVEAFLKCLIVKEIAGLKKSKFMLGDFNEFLKTTTERFDVIFCSGVLYHMSDPIKLIELMSKATDRVFVWTHVYDEARYSGGSRKRVLDKRYPEFELWQRDYGDSMNMPRFWGGNKQTSAWMRGDQMIDVFKIFGFTNLTHFDVSFETKSDAILCFSARKD